MALDYDVPEDKRTLYWLGDKLIGTFPVGTVALGLVGLGAGIVQIYKEAVKLAEGGNEKPPDPLG